MKTFLLSLLTLCLTSASASVHDTWVETNTKLIRTRDAVYINLKLGNHGNHHRDFKIASKIDLEGCRLDVIDPAGKVYDLISELTDTGYAPKEGRLLARKVCACETRLVHGRAYTGSNCESWQVGAANQKCENLFRLECPPGSGAFRKPRL